MGADDHLAERIMPADRLVRVHAHSDQQINNVRNPRWMDTVFRILHAQHAARLRVVGQHQERQEPQYSARKRGCWMRRSVPVEQGQRESIAFQIDLHCRRAADQISEAAGYRFQRRRGRAVRLTRLAVGEPVQGCRQVAAVGCHAGRGAEPIGPAQRGRLRLQELPRLQLAAGGERRGTLRAGSRGQHGARQIDRSPAHGPATAAAVRMQYNHAVLAVSLGGDERRPPTTARRQSLALWGNRRWCGASRWRR